MKTQDIVAYLGELGQELQHLGLQQPIRILLVGGAYMLTQFHNRSATNDIDILLKDIDDASSSSLMQLLRQQYALFRAETRFQATGSTTS